MRIKNVRSFQLSFEGSFEAIISEKNEGKCWIKENFTPNRPHMRDGAGIMVINVQIRVRVGNW